MRIENESIVIEIIGAQNIVQTVGLAGKLNLLAELPVARVARGESQRDWRSIQIQRIAIFLPAFRGYRLQRAKAAQIEADKLAAEAAAETAQAAA